MAIIGTGRLRNGLAVRNTGFFKDNRQFFIVLQTPFQRTQMEFALAVNNRLTQLFRLVDHPRRIFFVHTVQNSHHLLGIGFIHRPDGT